MKNIVLLGALLTITPIAACAQDKPAVKPLSFDQYKNSVNSVKLAEHKLSLAEFEKVADKPDTCILDLRTEDQYNDGHIKGAKHLGADITEERLAKLVPSKDSKIVLYCTNTLYPSRMISLNYSCLPQVLALGYKDVCVLDEVWHSDINAGQNFMTGPHWQTAQPKPNTTR